MEIDKPKKVEKKSRKVKKPKIVKKTADSDKPRAPNPWLEHVKKVKLENKDKKLKEILTIAKASYKK